MRGKNHFENNCCGMTAFLFNFKENYLARDVVVFVYNSLPHWFHIRKQKTQKLYKL